MAEYTNIFENSEVTGYNPDADGDYYKVTDGQLDHNYWQEKIAQALKVISTTPNDDFIIIYGGEVTDSGSGQVDIAEGAALGKDASGNIRLIIQEALTNVDLPSGWNDDRQIWVVGKYANKLGTPTRNHAATAESYHYTVLDSYVGESDNDDLFIDSDPTATSVCWGSFKMNGTTFTEQIGERSNEMVISLVADLIIQDQSAFNNSLQRVSANLYEFKDNIVSLVFGNLTGGYQMSVALTDGDTWGYIQTNNCKSIEFKGGAFIDFENERGYIEVNTDDCYLRNVDLQGTGTVVSAITDNFKLNAYRVIFDNCKCSNRLSNVDMVGFQGSATALHNITSKYINCSVYSLDGSDKIYGFKDCMNLSNCIAYDLDSSTGADYCYGFYLCSQISNCYAYQIDSGSGNAFGFHTSTQISACVAEDIDSTSGNTYGFSYCDNISGCYAYDIDSSAGAGSASGFHTCTQVSGCKAEKIDSGSGAVYGFYNCTQMSACKAEDIDSTSGNTYGFSYCDNISGCYAYDIDSSAGAGSVYGFFYCDQISGCHVKQIDSGSGDAYGFISCEQISACKAEDIDSVSGTASGFAGCQYGSAIYTAEATNASNDWMNTNDAQITNQYSCPAVFT